MNHALKLSAVLLSVSATAMLYFWYKCAIDRTVTFQHFSTEMTPTSAMRYENCSENVISKGRTNLDLRIKQLLSKLVIVTAFSSDHFKEGLDMIGSVQRQLYSMPGAKLVVYDIGMTDRQKRTISGMCEVELRLFNFSQYPAHVSMQNLKQYAWKPLIVDEVSNTFEVIMWGDASVRLLSPLQDILSYLLEADLPFFATSHHRLSYCVELTHKQTLKYLNMTAEKMKGFQEVQAGCWVTWITNKTKRFLNAWTDCALNRNCIAPEGAKLYVHPGCKYGDVNSTTFSGCHRFDQSALNVLLVREFGKDIRKSIIPGGKYSWKKTFTIAKKPTYDYPVQQCANRTS